jgi:hypothetical protein
MLFKFRYVALSASWSWFYIPAALWAKQETAPGGDTARIFYESISHQDEIHVSSLSHLILLVHIKKKSHPLMHQHQILITFSSNQNHFQNTSKSYPTSVFNEHDGFDVDSMRT